MNRKGEVTVRAIFIALVLLSMVSIGLVSFMDDLLKNYESEGAVPLTESEMGNYTQFNILSDLRNESDAFSTLIESGQTEKPNLLQTFLLAPSAIWSAIKMVFHLPGFIIGIITGILGMLGLPEWVGIGLVTITVMVIALIALNAIIGWKL